MFYTNTVVADNIRQNIFTFAMVLQDLTHESISDFTCHVNLLKDDSDRVFVDYIVRYESDDEEITVHNNFYCDYDKFIATFDKDPKEYTYNLLKVVLQEELTDAIDRRGSMDTYTRLIDIPKDLLNGEILENIRAFNKKVIRVRKHLEKLFQTDNPDDLSILSEDERKTLEMLANKGWFFEVGSVLIEDNKLVYQPDIIEPVNEFIRTFDELDKDDPELEEGLIGFTRYVELE